MLGTEVDLWIPHKQDAVGKAEAKEGVCLGRGGLRTSVSPAEGCNHVRGQQTQEGSWHLCPDLSHARDAESRWTGFFFVLLWSALFPGLTELPPEAPWQRFVLQGLWGWGLRLFSSLSYSQHLEQHLTCKRHLMSVCWINEWNKLKLYVKGKWGLWVSRPGLPQLPLPLQPPTQQKAGLGPFTEHRVPCTRLGALQTRSHLNYPKTYEEDIANPNVQVRKVELKEPERFVSRHRPVESWAVELKRSPDSRGLSPAVTSFWNQAHQIVFCVFLGASGIWEPELSCTTCAASRPKGDPGLHRTVPFFFLLLLFLSFSPFLFLLFPSLFLSFIFVSLAVLDWLTAFQYRRPN